MNLSHHLDDATLLALASGTIAHAHGIVAASHVALCPACAKALRKAESIGGGLLREGGVEPVSDMARAATLASLDGVSAVQRKPARKSELPAALDHALGGLSLDQIKWKKKAPGVALYDVPMPAGATSMLKLLSIGPGRAMPEHGHGGGELTMVLRGSYTDHMGTFRSGDVADLDDSIEHTPVADAGETCICVVAVEAPTRFKSVWARIFQPFVGI